MTYHFAIMFLLTNQRFCSRYENAQLWLHCVLIIIYITYQ